MKFLIGVFISFAVGAGCRFFDIPVPSPPVIPGALLVLAMTLGYATTDKCIKHTQGPALNAKLCGGPNGLSASESETKNVS